MNNSTAEHISNELLFTFETAHNKANMKLISERYGFADKLDIFVTIAQETMYGRRPVSSLNSSLENELGVSSETANYIAIELDQDLFSDARDEFNVAQGMMSIEEYESKYPPSEEAQTGDTEPSEQATPEPSSADPVAGSILGQNRRPGAQPDPYREPIDEE